MYLDKEIYFKNNINNNTILALKKSGENNG